MSVVTGTDKFGVGHALRAGAKPLTAEERSTAISFARIALICGLVFLHYGSFPNLREHNPFMGVDPHAHVVATYFNSFLLFFFFSAVPLLSAMSGWLFFSFSGEALPAMLARMRRRAATLYLPLFVWNAGYLALFSGVFFNAPDLEIFQHVKFPFGTDDPLKYINPIFGITQHPIAFQFWFVRDLFVTTLCSPLLWWLATRAPWAGAVVFGAVWLTEGTFFGLFFRTDVLFFFYLGALVRLHGVPLEIAPRVTWVLLALYLIAVGLRAAAPFAFDPGDAATKEMLDVVVRLMRVAGFLAAWGLVQMAIRTGWGRWFAQFGGLAFFVHSAHWPLLEIVKLALWPLMPGDGDAVMIAHYVLSVGVTVVVCMGAALVLARHAPRLFALMNGGREVSDVRK